jgi:hypothetical protein
MIMSYKGQFVKNRFNGRGILFYMNGNKYEGEFKADFEHGKGIKFFYKNSKFKEIQSNFERGSPHDKHCKILFTNGTIYEGGIVRGEIAGVGEIYYQNDPSRSKYEGNWYAGKYHGLGMITYLNGSQYNGNWEKGQKNGLGVYRFQFGGHFKKYKGEFERNEFSGNGVLYMDNGSKYIGTFKRGQKHGYGRIVDDEGEEVKQGKWYEGEFKNSLKKDSDIKKLDKLVKKILLETIYLL